MSAVIGTVFVVLDAGFRGKIVLLLGFPPRGIVSSLPWLFDLIFAGFSLITDLGIPNCM